MNDAAGFVYNRLVSQGIHPTYAAAAIGHLAEESGWFAPDVVAGKRRGDSGTAAYIAQWRGERLANLERFARDQGRPIDLATQVDFIVHEGKAGLDKGAAVWYSKATSGQGDLRDATAAFAYFERPQGFTWDNPYGTNTFDKRMAHAQKFAGSVGDDGIVPSNYQPPSQPYNAPTQGVQEPMANPTSAPVPGMTNPYNTDIGDVQVADAGVYSLGPGLATHQNRMGGQRPYDVAFSGDDFLEGTF